MKKFKKNQPFLFKEFDFVLSEAAFVHLYHKYKTNAKSKKRKFKLTKEQFKILTSSNCFYCGNPPNYLFNRLHKGKPVSEEPYIYNGVDRVNPEKGYIISNCVSCCAVCNKMKGSLSSDSFQEKIKKIYQYLKLHA